MFSARGGITVHVSTEEDVYRMICAGADASGGTSGVLNAPNPVQKLEEMIRGMIRAKSRETGKQTQNSAMLSL